MTFFYSFLKEDLCAVIYHSGGQNTRNNGQPHRTGGCFSCLGRKVRIHKALNCGCNERHTCETLFIKNTRTTYTFPTIVRFIIVSDTEIRKIRCLPGTIFAPYPLSNAGSLLQLLDAMHSPQKAEMISSLERCGVFLTSSHRKSSQS